MERFWNEGKGILQSLCLPFLGDSCTSTKMTELGRCRVRTVEKSGSSDSIYKGAVINLSECSYLSHNSPNHLWICQDQFENLPFWPPKVKLNDFESQKLSSEYQPKNSVIGSAPACSCTPQRGYKHFVILRKLIWVCQGRFLVLVFEGEGWFEQGLTM